MRHKDGHRLMPLWKYCRPDGPVILAAWTREDAYYYLSHETNYLFKDSDDGDISRLKGCCGDFITPRIVAL